MSFQCSRDPTNVAKDEDSRTVTPDMDRRPHIYLPRTRGLTGRQGPWLLRTIHVRSWRSQGLSLMGVLQRLRFMIPASACAYPRRPLERLPTGGNSTSSAREHQGMYMRANETSALAPAMCAWPHSGVIVGSRDALLRMLQVPSVVRFRAGAAASFGAPRLVRETSTRNDLIMD
jgi:hypothetical protein